MTSEAHPSRTPPAPRLAAAAVLALAAGCGAPEVRWPFPKVESSSDDAVARTLRERVARVRSLYGVISMSFELPERSGVAEAVVRYRSPGAVRMTAYKDILVASRDVFDLAITPERFELRIEGDGGSERHAGPADDLVKLHPGFRAVGALREAMFLPGLCDPGSPPRISRRDGLVFARSLAPGGGVVEWELDRSTLGVRRARLTLDTGVITVEYPSYREVEGRFLPERFELRDPEVHVRIAGALDELELNPDLPPSDFQVEP